MDPVLFTSRSKWEAFKAHAKASQRAALVFDDDPTEYPCLAVLHWYDDWNGPEHYAATFIYREMALRLVGVSDLSEAPDRLPRKIAL